MTRTAFTPIATLAFALLTGPTLASAQPATQSARIACLDSNPRWAQGIKNLELRLRDHGWFAGTNLIVDRRYPRDVSGLARLGNLATELVSLKPDVIVTFTTEATRAAIEATRTIPIVFAWADDPVANGFVTSLARPGGNVTGVATLTSELAQKRLDLIKDVRPGVSRIAVLWEPLAVNRPMFEHVRAAGQALRLTIQSHEVRGRGDFSAAFAAMTRDRADAVLLLTSSMMIHDQGVAIATLAARHRLPIMSSWTYLTHSGGLMSYTSDTVEVLGQTAALVNRILRGAKPADLPVEQPTKFELVINLKTAKALGLTIPPSVLARADEVIE